MRKKCETALMNKESLGDAVWNNIFETINPFIHSTAFKTYAMQYRMPYHSSAITSAEEFLMNSHYRNDDIEMCYSVLTYLENAGITMVSLIDQEDNQSNHEIKLPKGVPLTMELGKTLRQRRSVRQYTGQACGLDYLAALLRAGSMVTAQKKITLPDGDIVTMYQRTAPSGGGLYPIDTYVLALNVRRLKKGLYRYHSINDSLIQLSDETILEKLLSAFAVSTQQLRYTHASIIIMLIGHPWRSMRKYGARGLRFVMHEAGSIAQNIHLATAALGLGSVDCASVYDDEVHDILNLDGRYASLMDTIVIGTTG